MSMDIGHLNNLVTLVVFFLIALLLHCWELPLIKMRTLMYIYVTLPLRLALGAVASSHV